MKSNQTTQNRRIKSFLDRGMGLFDDTLLVKNRNKKKLHFLV